MRWRIVEFEISALCRGYVQGQRLDDAARLRPHDRGHADGDHAEQWQLAHAAHQRLTAQEPVSLSDLGDQFGVSKERIRQVEARIKKRLRVFLEDEIGEEIGFEFDIREDD